MIKGLSPFFHRLANVVFGQPQNDSPYGSIEAWLDYYRSRNKEQPSHRGEFDVNAHPKVSVLVLTYNNLLFNQLCLESIYANTRYPNFEVIVVDNASTDGTVEWLKQYSTTRPNLRLILNSENKGFAAGNNQAAREAAGEYLVFLNNDTVVTNGWIEGLLDHLRAKPQIGLVGPVTNSTGNEARIITSYTSPEEMEAFADQQRRNMSGQAFDIRMLAFYCVMVHKDQYETLGGLDERYGVGMFEDDDLAVQYNKAGFKALCAEDVFIHHFQGMSFGKMQNSDYLRVFSENRQKYEAKWGKKWEPYQLRPEVMQHLLKNNAINPNKTSPLDLFIFLGGIIWALYVIIRYFGVDDGFLFDNLKEWNALTDVIKYLLAFAGMFGFGLILRNVVDENPRRRLAGVLFAGILGTALVYFGEQAADSWLQWMDLFDGVKVPLLLAVFLTFGVGLGFGSRIGNSPLKFWFLSAILLVPFLIITTFAGALPSLLGLIWVFLLSFVIGEVLLLHLAEFFKIASQQIENKMGLLPLAVGLGVMVLGALILGSLGAASNVGVILFLAVITIFCLSRFPGIFGRLKLIPWNQPVNVNEIELGALSLLAALFTIYWIGALAPEVGADAIGQRVAVPAMWLREGIIRPLPEMLFSYNFFAGEVIYYLIMPFAGFTAAKVTQFALSLVLVVGTFFEVFEFRHRRSLALYLFAFWGSTVVWWQLIWGFVDLVQLFFYFSSILAVRYWLDDQENPIWLIAAGIIGSLAASVKLNGAGAVIIAELAVMGLSLYRTRSFIKSVRNGLYVLIPALIFITPWFVSSYITTGNPVFPFANRLFESPLSFPDFQKNTFGVGLELTKIFNLPWDFFFKPLTFGSLGTFHPFILTIAPLAIWGFVRVNKRDRLWLFAGGLASVLWLVTEQNSRYAIYAIYLVSIAFGIGLLKWQDKFFGTWSKVFFQFFLLFVLIWGFAMQAMRPAFWMRVYRSGPTFPVDVVLGDQSESDYLALHVPTYSCAQWLNRHYGENAYVWQVSARDHLYFQAKVTSLPHAIRPLAEPLIEASNVNLPGDNSVIHKMLVDAGYSHILYSRRAPWQVDSVSGVFSQTFVNAFLQLECADRGLLLYKIRPTLFEGESPFLGKHNLLINSDFEMNVLDDDIENWILTGQGGVKQFEGNTFVELRDSATLIQSVVVDEDQMYQITVDYKIEDFSNNSYIQINWFNSSEEMILFQRETVEVPEGGVFTFRFYQTSPLGARSAVVYVNGTGVSVDNIYFRIISSEMQAP